MKKSFVLVITIAMFFCTAHAQSDIAVEDVFPLEYQVPGTHSFEVAIRTYGPQGYGTMNIGWKLNNGAIQTEAIPAGAAPEGRIERTAFTLNFPAAGTYTLKLWVKGIIPADPNPADDTITKTIKVLAVMPKKNVVLEVYKHLICCPCLPAAWYEDTVIKLNPTYAIANIYTEFTDSIYLADGKIVNDVYNTGHPMPIFDRFKFPYSDVPTSFYTTNNGYGLDGYGLREQYYEPVKVSFKTVSYNATTRVLKVKLSAQFYDDLSGDFRFNMYVTEDSVKAYQGCAPDPDNYYHMHVVRVMSGGPWGLQGSLPAVIHNNDVKEYEFTYTIPANYKTSQMKIIGMVQTYNTDDEQRRILNSDQISFANALTLSTETITNLKDEVRVYPNPAKDKLTISLTNKAGKEYTVTLYDMNGRMLQTVKTSINTELDVHTLAAGSYMLRIDDGKEVYSEQITKE